MPDHSMTFQTQRRLAHGWGTTLLLAFAGVVALFKEDNEGLVGLPVLAAAFVSGAIVVRAALLPSAPLRIDDEQLSMLTGSLLQPKRQTRIRLRDVERILGDPEERATVLRLVTARGAVELRLDLLAQESDRVLAAQEIARRLARLREPLAPP